MGRWLVTLGMLSVALAGCPGPRVSTLELEEDSVEAALDPDATRTRSVTPEISRRSEAEPGAPNPVPAAGGSGRAGDPVYSTSFAIELARLTLREAGVECEERGVQVTYFEGVYTVCFPRPEGDRHAADYTVDIRETDSRVLKIVTKAE